MSIRAHPNKVIELRLQGRYAHFRKFYTNASSLTFTIPPRTSLVGLFASVLEMERDSYYEALASDNLRIAVSLSSGLRPRKFMQTLNYVYDNTTKSPINDVSKHRQCRCELLTGQESEEISYRVWLGYNTTNQIMMQLESKLKEHDFGFGIYLGQRQFRAELCIIEEYLDGQFSFLETAEYVDSSIVCEKASPHLSVNQDLLIERLPLEQSKEVVKKDVIRRLSRIEDILFDSSGGRIAGSFKECYRINNRNSEVISFL